MSDRGLIRLEWGPRETPLVPVAAAACGDAALALAQRLLKQPARLAARPLVAGDRILVVLAASEELPWVDDILYLGRDQEAPGLLLPTNLTPTIPLAIAARALTRQAAAARAPVAVIPSRRLLVSLADAFPATPGRLQAWLEGTGGG